MAEVEMLEGTEPIMVRAMLNDAAAAKVDPEALTQAKKVFAPSLPPSLPPPLPPSLSL